MTGPIWRGLMKGLVAAGAGTLTVAIHALNNDFCYTDGLQRGPQWNKDWDGKQLEHLLKPKGPSFRSHRNIILITNGQYLGRDKGLTSLGQEQAELTAYRLCKLKLDYNYVIQTSDGANCLETAKIIASKLKPKKSAFTYDALRDGVAIEPDPPLVHWITESGDPAPDLFKSGARMEFAFRSLFHRSDADEKHDTYDIVVTHPNVIRYFICRVLQLPPEAWLRFSLRNCSITWIQISPDGYVRAKEIGVCGHLPKGHITEF